MSNPNIALINECTITLPFDVNALCAALQKFVDQYFAPVWGTPCTLTVCAPGSAPSDFWQLVLLDNSDQAGALGYHDVTAQGLPVSKIFCKTTIDDGEDAAVTACHELAEMLVDPGIQMSAEAQTGVFYAYEVCDAVEETTFQIDGLNMSNFVFPEYFESFHAPGSVQFDYLKQVNKPFDILPGGYMPVFKRGKWRQILGPSAKKKAPGRRVRVEARVAKTRPKR